MKNQTNKDNLNCPYCANSYSQCPCVIKHDSIEQENKKKWIWANLTPYLIALIFLLMLIWPFYLVMKNLFMVYMGYLP